MRICLMYPPRSLKILGRKDLSSERADGSLVGGPCKNSLHHEYRPGVLLTGTIQCEYAPFIRRRHESIHTTPGRDSQGNRG